jgi:ribonuclease BN (tRNA processing enzyme)
MRLTIVGCSGSYPGPDSAASCYLVEAGDTRIVLDLGNGALGPLQRYANLDGIDAVLLSHLHPDHCLDLCSYFIYRRYRPEGLLPRIPVYGSTGVAERMAAAYGQPPERRMHEAFEFVEWSEETRYEIGPVAVTVARVAHPVLAYGMRIEHAGRVLAFSGDTGPCAALERVAQDADLFLCEAAFQVGGDSTPGLHLNGREAAEAATRAGARGLVLTHVPPWNDPSRTLAEAAPAFDGHIELARPGLVLEIG